MDNDDIIITINDETLTIDSHTLEVYNVSDISINNSTVTWDDSYIYDSGTIDLDNLTITLNDPVEFEDHMPSVAKVEDMCNDYPALRKAYENFKTIYKMVRQDWQGRQDAENEPPF